MKENTFNFYIYIYVSTAIWENVMGVKIALWIQILFRVDCQKYLQGAISVYPSLACVGDSWLHISFSSIEFPF